jgi:hypothetical protein
MPHWYIALTILVYATFHFGICHFPFWYVPLSILGYVDHMYIICKDIITNLKYVTQKVLKSVDLDQFNCGNQFVHCPLLFRGAAAHRAGPRSPGRSVRGAAARPVGRPVCGRHAAERRLEAGRPTGQPGAPPRCGLRRPGRASRAQQPGPSAGPSADATQWRAVWRRAGRRACPVRRRAAAQFLL